MENKTENTALPLYKVLIERQKIEGGLIPSILAAQEFTMLAVNNLVPLAEALQNLYNATCSIESSQYFADELRAAKAALANIS